MEHERHYGKVPYKSKECDIVLTRLLVCDKELCNLFFKCKPLVENIYREGTPYGNGEDIVFSFIAKLAIDDNLCEISNRCRVPCDHSIYIGTVSS